jgi:hypothetical protein
VAGELQQRADGWNFRSRQESSSMPTSVLRVVDTLRKGQF